jgi:hypothetical protein
MCDPPAGDILITFPAKIAGMVKAKQPSTKRGSLFIDALNAMLTEAIRDRQDFIITFEPRDGDETKQDVHVMTGKLINPCMLNTLKHRVSLYSDEGAKVMTRSWE